MMTRESTKAYLVFENGIYFKGIASLTPEQLIHFKKQGHWGEAAFTSAMTGYQETATDPSFLGQHIIFTAAHVGNYPAVDQVAQSKKIAAVSLIARNFSKNAWLDNCGVPLFHSCDVRAIVKYLTNNPHHKAVISNTPLIEKRAFIDFVPTDSDLKKVSQEQVMVHQSGEMPIVAINYGMKLGILENLKKLGYPLISVPYDTCFDDILAFKPRLVFLSNGPGDPREYLAQINVVKELLKAKIPVRAICLGHQLISLALGLKVEKLAFGHRGINHPVLEHLTGKVLITSQNHGYAVASENQHSLLKENDYVVSYSSLFDGSVEGITQLDHLVKTVQFHPEASPGPHDAAPFFSEIKHYLENFNHRENLRTLNLTSAKSLEQLKVFRKTKYQKVLVIGSGPIKIGQASEFDYSGTQACRSLAAAGVKVILLNSNPATIMTDKDLAYKTYLEPISKDNIKKIIKKEGVDAILSTMGGQTALNLAVELEKEGVLARSGVELLGANARTIELTENRNLFSLELTKLGFSTGKRKTVISAKEALAASETDIGLPLIIRNDFALGGAGATFIFTKEELHHYLLRSEVRFPLTLEKSLRGWKEVELEVMVDCEQNGLIICSIENIDPCGVHTGDSITVAPAQTISDVCMQKMRTMALVIAKHMGVVAGGANVQFAINPFDDQDIVVIEMNPRVSRSSALASKATGYPIAKISALLAIGYTLKDIINDITQSSPVSFEPTQDYVAVKIPVLPFHKFPSADTRLGPQMRAVGEVLAIGGNFNEAFMKALRSLEVNLEIPSLYHVRGTPFEISNEYIENRLGQQMELCLVTVLAALKRGLTKQRIFELSFISPWFIEQMQDFLNLEMQIDGMEFKSLAKDRDLFIQAKRFGFSDKFLAKLTNCRESTITKFRQKENILPAFKAVDTCSGEFAAETPYFYSTYETQSELRPFGHLAIAIIGSGPNRIGQGIEFDYSCVKACETLRHKGIKSIMINSNPETVSTDYDSSDRLYLAPLYSEDVFDILTIENPRGVISCFSGQTGILLREILEKSFRAKLAKFNFLGPSSHALEITEDRKLFADYIMDLPLSQTKSREVKGYQNLVDTMIDMGFPLIIRPSYVIGGESMFIFTKHEDIHTLPLEIKQNLQNGGMVFQVETYLENALEYDVDLIRDQEGHCIFTVSEHIEHAGVHSGDSGMITPPICLTPSGYQKLKNVSIQMAEKLNIVGPINIQFAIKNEDIFCIEANPRGSRTLPFLSKAYDLNLPRLAVEAMIGESIVSFDTETMKYFCVKQSTFPFDRFPNDSIILGPKMLSTGETMGIDFDKHQAVLKSYLGNYPHLQKPGKILMSLSDKTKNQILPYLKLLDLSGFSFVATKGTAAFIQKQGFACEVVNKINEDNHTILDYIKGQDLRMVFNTPVNFGQSQSDGQDIRQAAIKNTIPCFTRIENIKAVIESVLGCHKEHLTPICLQDLPHVHS
jgi:carbamoyl-phosphate synthase large subunit